MSESLRWLSVTSGQSPKTLLSRQSPRQAPQSDCQPHTVPHLPFLAIPNGLQFPPHSMIFTPPCLQPCCPLPGTTSPNLVFCINSHPYFKTRLKDHLLQETLLLVDPTPILGQAGRPLLVPPYHQALSSVLRCVTLYYHCQPFSPTLLRAP